MAESLRILVVDDNRSAADALARVLRKGGDDVTALYDGASAIARIESDPPDAVLTDLKMEPIDGMAVLRAARAQRPPVECVVFTAYGDLETAVHAMRLGARDFLTKPVTVEQVAARLAALRRPTTPAVASHPLPFLSNSPASKQLLIALGRAADVQSRVWIEGELGSGRVFCAETLHGMSGAPGPLTVRDLGRDDPWPASGTVVLPSVDDLPEDLQRRLHRELQVAPPDLRIVATAGLDARQRVREGSLRPELYYALAVIVVSVPPLRDRVEDIAPLFHGALAAFASRYQRRKPMPSQATVDSLEGHAWPGNVRELFNLAERMVVMGADEPEYLIAPRTSSSGVPELGPGFNLATYLETVERRILEEALRQCEGDRNAAGRLLGVERNTLRYKLNKYHLLDR